MSVLRKRRIAKAFSWRVFASILTFLIGWVVTGDVEFGVAIGGLDVVLKLIFYYLHERLWYKSSFGIIHDEDDHKNI